MNKEIKNWWDSLYLSARQEACTKYNIELDDIDNDGIVKLYNRIALTSQMI